MQVPLKIGSRKLELGEDIEGLIRERTDKLHRFCSDIVSCRVAVEQSQNNQSAGGSYRVRLEVHLPPGKELVAAKDSASDDLPDDLDTVIRRTFDAMERQLKDSVGKRRGSGHGT